MFPRLTGAQLERLRPLGRPRRFAAAEMIYERGSAKRAFYVLLEGRVEIASLSRVGEERITVHGAGEFLGEVDMMSGAHSLVQAKALDAAMQRRRVRFVWVKGHAGHELNEAADRLANGAAAAWKDGAAPHPGPGFPGSVVQHPEARPGQVVDEPDLFSDL